jgi:hypothetical protein
MSTFVKGGGVSTPFGRNEFLRSVKDVKTASYTVSAAACPSRTIDGNPGQKILQPGTVMAKITSGPEAGKIGPYQGGGTNEVQTLTKVGTISGGTFTITFNGQTTAPIQWNATAADVQAALIALSNVGVGEVAVTGGPINTAPFVITFQFGSGGADEPQVTVDTTLLTGTTPGITPATQTPGTPGAADGRQTAANIVGLLVTFLPWQLTVRDVEVSVTPQCTAVQAWCKELDTTGAEQALSNTTADAMRGTKLLQINFV